MRFYFKYCLLLLFAIGAQLPWSTVQAQGLDSNRLSSGKPIFAVLPIIYYTPETRFAYGLSGISFFKTDSLSRVSSVQVLGAYTQNKQILSWLPFQLFLKEDNYWVQGELAFYRYPYFFSGVGNEVPNGYEEDYTAQFPRFRLTGMKKVAPNLYAGAQYWFQNTNIREREAGGLLEQGAPGGDGGTTSGIGWAVNYDKRDIQFFPSKGAFVQLRSLFNQQELGSDFTYNNYIVDARKYLSIQSHVLALQGYADIIFGGPPFNQMAQLGGENRMRGYRLGTYRDRKMLVSQLEYRSPYIWRISFVGFGGYGGVADNFEGFSTRTMRFSYGAGMRFLFDSNQRLNMRFDYGFGDDGNRGFYFTFGEAF